MDMKSIQFGVVGLLVGGLIVGLIMNNTQYGYRGMMYQGDYNNQMAVSGQIDAHFIEQMIPHHEDAIIMAELALEKAQREELKQLAQSIIDSQSTEIEDMKEWYEDWYGRELTTSSSVGMHHGMGGHMGMSQIEVDRLEQSDNFDRAFIESMIPHHQMAVMMASMLKNGSNREEMKQLADDIIVAQTTEIDQMQDWYNEWF